jgi:hypothetical protein
MDIKKRLKWIIAAQFFIILESLGILFFKMDLNFPFVVISFLCAVFTIYNIWKLSDYL